MGLDMYLEKRTYVKNWDFLKPEDRTLVTVTKGGKPVSSIDPKKITFIVEEAGYWRKANAVHQWFVDHVQDGNDDCGYYYVSEEKLKELLQAVNTILENSALQGEAVVTAAIAQELLPTSSGFFFGSTEYDSYYLDDLKLTKEILEGALSDSDASYYYHSSW